MQSRDQNLPLLPVSVLFNLWKASIL